MFYLAPALKKIPLCLAVPTLLLAVGGHANARQNRSTPAAAVARAVEGADSAQDGLTGPVRRVRTEVAGLLSKDGKLVEGPRELMEVTVYDRQGRKVDHSVYAVSGGQPVGKEVYKHDARGNVVEMTVRDAAGSVVSQEVYAYDFDAIGNWTKMTTSVAVVENSNVTYEPTEVAYRTITYYRTDAVAKATLAPPAPAGEEPGRAASEQNPQKNEAAETGATKQIAGLTADSESQAATGQQAASGQPAIVPTAAGAPQPLPAPAEDFESANGAIGAAKTAGDGGSAESERQAAVPPQAGESEVRPTSKAASGGVLNGRAIELPLPIYSELVRRWGYEGTVTVKVNIDVAGRVISAHAVSGPHQLRAAAEEAARRARFSPTLLSGQPIEISGVINYVFSLKQ
jgi:periplasmic protein TonB